MGASPFPTDIVAGLIKLFVLIVLGIAVFSLLMWVMS